MLTQTEKEMIAKGYALPGLYAATQDKRDAAHREWMKREAITTKLDKIAAPHF